MENKQYFITPMYIIDVILRRRWYILIPVCLSFIAGIYFAITQPKTYEASTLILVQSKGISEAYVRPTMTEEIDSRIQTLSQQIMSNTNLEKVINDFGLFSGIGSNKMVLEKKVQALRSSIDVVVTRSQRGRGGADSFTITYRGGDPEKVMKITDALASFFIERNQSDRESQAIGTNAFLETELKTMRTRLASVEQKLKNYRQKYMGGLPEQLEGNITILSGLQEQLTSSRKGLIDAKNRLIAIQTLLSQAPNVITQVAPENIENASDPVQLRVELTRLRTKYTENHPDIIKLKKTIINLEKLKNEENSRSDTDSSINAFNAITPQREQQILQREQAKGDINTYEAEIANLLSQIASYKIIIKDTPKREQELFSLNRDYQNIREKYNSLLGRKMEAEISVNMEKEKKGDQFNIIDRARLPQIPVAPNMPMLFLVFCAAGAIMGLGIVVLLEVIDKSFRLPEDVESYLGLPVISTIPVLPNRMSRVLGTLNMVLIICFSIITISIFSGFAMITFIGFDSTLEFINEYVYKMV